MKNLVGGKHIITEQCGALSLVRGPKKEKADHAYLIMELINDKEELLLYKIYLTPNEKDPTKATVKYESTNAQDIIALGKHGSSFTWNVNSSQMAHLKVLVESEIERTNQGKVYYLHPSKTTRVPSAISADSAYPSQLADKLKSINNLASMDGLLFTGHTSYSWALAMVKALELASPKKQWSAFFVDTKEFSEPKFTGQSGKKHESDDDKEPTSPKPSCLTM